MDDEIVVYLAVLAQRGNICKDGFGHTEQLHSLVYDVGTQVIGQAAPILSGFLPSIRLDKITITGEGGFKLHQMPQQAFGQYLLNCQEIAVPPAVLVNAQGQPPACGKCHKFLSFCHGGGERLLHNHMLTCFEGAAGILIMSAVRCVDDNQIQLFHSDKFLKTPHNTSVGILLPGEFLTALRNGSQFKMRVSGDEGGMENTSRHSVSG